MRFQNHWWNPKTPLKWNWSRELDIQKAANSRGIGFKDVFRATFNGRLDTSGHRDKAKERNEDVTWTSAWKNQKWLTQRRRKELHRGMLIGAMDVPRLGFFESDRTVAALQSIAKANSAVLIQPHVKAQALARTQACRLDAVASVSPAVWWTVGQEDLKTSALYPDIATTIGTKGSVTDTIMTTGDQALAHQQHLVLARDTERLRSMQNAVAHTRLLTSAAVLGMEAKAFILLLTSWPSLGIRDAALEGSLVVAFANQINNMHPMEAYLCLRALLLVGQVKALQVGDFDLPRTLPRHIATDHGARKLRACLLASCKYHAARDPNRLIEYVYMASLYCSLGGAGAPRLKVPSITAASEAIDDPSGVSASFVALAYGCHVTRDIIASVTNVSCAVMAFHITAASAVGLTCSAAAAEQQRRGGEKIHCEGEQRGTLSEVGLTRKRQQNTKQLLVSAARYDRATSLVLESCARVEALLTRTATAAASPSHQPPRDTPTAPTPSAQAANDDVCGAAWAAIGFLSVAGNVLPLLTRDYAAHARGGATVGREGTKEAEASKSALSSSLAVSNNELPQVHPHPQVVRRAVPASPMPTPRSGGLRHQPLIPPPLVSSAATTVAAWTRSSSSTNDQHLPLSAAIHQRETEMTMAFLAALEVACSVVLNAGPTGIASTTVDKMTASLTAIDDFFATPEDSTVELGKATRALARGLARRGVVVGGSSSNRGEIDSYGAQVGTR